MRSAPTLTSAAVDPNNGNLYAVWQDGRFSSKYSHDSIAFSMSTDGGLTWSDPIQVNQTPTNIPDGDQQAFTPTVAVNSDGTVAVTYYDFRNNDASPGLPTDYWLVHASSNLTNPNSWTSDEKRLTDTSFNMENAARTSRGYFLGDYEGLAAAGSNFYALFGQAGPDSSDPSNIWFRDPPPAGATRDSGVLSPRLVPTDLSATSSGTTGNSSPAASPTGSAAIATIATPAPAANTTAQDQYFAHHHNKIADSDWAEGLAVSLAV